MKRFLGVIYLTGAFSLAGTSVIAARFVSGQLGIFTITAASLFFALLGLLPLCIRHLVKTMKQLALRDWLILLFQAVCGIFLFRMFLLLGLLLTSTGEAGILTGATPAMTVVLAKLLLKEPMNKGSITGIVSTTAGVLLLQGILLPGSSFTIEHLVGNVLVLCAAASESLFNVLSRISSLRTESGRAQALNPIVQTMLVAGIAFLLCLFPALSEQPVLSLMSLSIKAWLALVWYGLFVTALAFVFWYAGISRCQASTAAAFSGMMPFTSLLLSVFLLGENAGWQQWLGGLLVILGMILIGRQIEATAVT